jgi:hypothetical protein
MCLPLIVLNDEYYNKTKHHINPFPTKKEG